MRTLLTHAAALAALVLAGCAAPKPTFDYSTPPAARPASAPLPFAVVVPPVRSPYLDAQQQAALQAALVRDLRGSRLFMHVASASDDLPPGDAVVMRWSLDRWRQRRLYHGLWLAAGVALGGAPFLLPLPFAHSTAEAEGQARLEFLWPAELLHTARFATHGRGPNFDLLWNRRQREPRAGGKALQQMSVDVQTQIARHSGQIGASFGWAQKARDARLAAAKNWRRATLSDQYVLVGQMLAQQRLTRDEHQRARQAMAHDRGLDVGGLDATLDQLDRACELGLLTPERHQQLRADCVAKFLGAAER